MRRFVDRAALVSVCFVSSRMPNPPCACNHHALAWESVTWLRN